MVGASQKISKSGPDPEALRRALAGPEGQALLRMLQSDGGKGLQAAAAALSRGDQAGAKEALAPLLGPEAEGLTAALEGKL